MIQSPADPWFPGGIGEDIFGETYAARILRQDVNNQHLLMKMLREYI